MPSGSCPTAGPEVEHAWEVRPGARYSDSLLQTLDQEVDKRRELNTWMDTYDKDEKQRAKYELALAWQDPGRYEQELALIEYQMDGACGKG